MNGKILIVDDEPLYLRLLKVNLETEGFEIVSANNGEQAVELVASQKPQLVILDVMMPKVDGITACERIRQFSNVPVIMLTAKGEEKDRVRGFAVGADDYVVKPFSVTELVARVHAVLRRAKSRRKKLKAAFSSMGICALILPVLRFHAMINLFISPQQNIDCCSILPAILGKFSQLRIS